ncbi:hypothetical protein Hrubri_3741 [Herbaspirillum rubrisubalbicans M1]|uniref:hypothetical protein n=1 Tax=Herbaspirillum rubrisubalbicans TaxID=80842 RepID=UPI00073A37F1|nr:hypothetical protein [Herbaspirillum rubrisubalbicans]ALU90898.1 hypothetical protein Hrubri_3741 [Herbaspirillum rubrisubalbicans M1]
MTQLKKQQRKRKKKLSRKGNKKAATTNRTKDSGVEVIVRRDDTGDWIKPTTGEKFYIDEDALFPDVEFEFTTDVPGPYVWTWEMIWSAQVSSLSEKERGRTVKNLRRAGKFTQDGRHWNARSIGAVIGGTLRIVVQVGQQEFIRTVKVLAKQPGADRIKAHIRERNEPLMEKLIHQESRFKHVINNDLEPIVAGDRGFGVVQLTNPMPSYSQIWSWKENVDAGIALLRQKRAAAKRDFEQQKPVSYTAEMLDTETITRWNGGKYHEWDEGKKKWVRQKSILCDSKTGNVGWNMTLESNAGKTESELHDRDKGTYRKMKEGQNEEHAWQYSGVCYADHIEKR